MWILLMIHFHLVNNATAIDHIAGFTNEAACLEMKQKISEGLSEVDGLTKELTIMCVQNK